MQSITQRLIGILLIVGSQSAASGNLSVALSNSAVTDFQQTNVLAMSSPVTDTLIAPGPGQLSFTVTDFAASPLLDGVTFSVSGIDGAIIAQSPPGSVTLDVSSASTFYISLFAIGSGTTGLAIYDITGSFTPEALLAVPISSTGLLLLSGILAAAALGRYRIRRATVTLTVA